MTESDRLELEDVLKRAKFRAECAKRTDLAWFILDELEERKRRLG